MYTQRVVYPQQRTALADGQVPQTAAVVYRAPPGVLASVDQIRVFNTSATPQTIVLSLNLSGARRKFSRVVLEQNTYADMLDKGIELDGNDAVFLETTTAAVVDYVVLGREPA